MTRYAPGDEIPQATAVPDGSGLDDPLIGKESGENNAEPEFTRGEVQERACRDVLFAILFLAMITGISVVAGTKGKDESERVSTPHASKDLRGFMFYLLSTVCVSLGFSGLGLAVLTFFTEHIITFSLLFSVAVSLSLAISCIIAKNVFGAILGFIGTLLGLCYFCLVQNRIPFATANIQTASAATRKNSGVYLIGYLFVLINISFLVVWAIAMFGVIHGAKNCDNNGHCHIGVNIGLILLMALSLFFAHQVFKNCVHVTVAGIVGTWWFSPEEANSCCSTAVRGSTFRTLTTSFGSVCFGSFLVAIISTLKALVESLRQDQNNDGGEACLLCCLDCILGCIENIAELFNRYAFIYVGLYGYSFLEAGANVMNLFDTSGFSVIINDNLVITALNFLTFAISLMSAGIGILINRAQPEWLSLFHNDSLIQDPNNSKVPAFLVSLVGGVIVSNVLFGIIESAVNTIIVCFAEAPAEFDRNHPEHSRKIREAWRQVYDFVPPQ